jgi:hypothetical protein
MEEMVDLWSKLGKKKGQDKRPFQALYPFATGKKDSLRA